MVLTSITTGMEKGPEAIDANFKAVDNSVATLTEGQKLTWIDLPLEKGITGGLSVAEAYNGSIIYINGQINTTGDFRNMLISKCTGTPLANLSWVNLPVTADSGVENIQLNGNGDMGYRGTATKQINANGLFAK